MRVVVASDALAGLSPAEASEIIAHAFADRGARVVVVPLGVTGAALHEAVGVAGAAALEAPADAAELGRVLARAMEELRRSRRDAPAADRPRLLLDPTDVSRRDLAPGGAFWERYMDIARAGRHPRVTLAATVEA